MTKTILKRVSLTKEHEKALEIATSKEYIKKVKACDEDRRSRFISIRNKPNVQIKRAMAKDK